RRGRHRRLRGQGQADRDRLRRGRHRRQQRIRLPQPGQVRLPGPPLGLRARTRRPGRVAHRLNGGVASVSIVGVGIDVVPVERFAETLRRTPALAERLFTEAERVTGAGAPRTAESLAARFAAKEALAKSLGAGGGMLWTDAEVLVDDAG